MSSFKKFVQNLKLAFKKAYSISLLPAKVESFHSSIPVRIFRVIGGICLLLVLTGNYHIFYKEFQFLIMGIALLHSFLIIGISLIKFFYGLYIIIKRPDLFKIKD